MRYINYILIYLILVFPFLLSGCFEPFYNEYLNIPPSYANIANSVKEMSPKPGSQNVVVGTSIQIKFNRPMNEDSVKKNFYISPNVVGEYIWPDKKLLIFKPVKELAYDTTYKITINDTALDTYGNKMESTFTASFTTPMGAPYVISTTPAKNETNVSVYSNIEIKFSEPVDHTSAINGFFLTPYHAGVFSFNGSTMIFNPDKELTTNTTYTVKLTKVVKDLAGNYMKDEYTFTFTTSKAIETDKPYIVSVEVVDNTTVRIEFNEELKQSTAENRDNYSATNGLVISGAVLLTGRKIVELTTSPQAEGQIYYLTVKNIQDLAGNTMVTSSEYGFKGIQPPELLSAVPLSNTMIEVSFSEPVGSDTASIKENYFVAPFLSVNSADPVPDDAKKVRLSTGNQISGLQYTLTVKNIKDLQGNVIKKNNSVKFNGIP